MPISRLMNVAYRPSPTHTPRSPRTTLAHAIALIGFVGHASCAYAEEPTSSTPLAEQKIEVTGSRIKRLSKESTSPLQVFKREDIVRVGASSVKDLLETLASASSNSLSDASGSFAFAGGASAVSLRNLGKQSTLLLVNGRRVAPFAITDFAELFTNVDAIPLETIERVEILKSGASAIYGSDAVAGVINLITRQNFRGAEVQINQQQSITNGEFGVSSAGATLGLGDLAKDKFNFLLNVNAYQRQEVIWRNVLGYANTNLAAKSAEFGAPSYYASPGNLGIKLFNSGGLAPNIGALPNCPAERRLNGACTFDNYSRLQAAPAADRGGIFSTGQFLLSDTLTAFVELAYTKNKTSYSAAPKEYGAYTPTINYIDPATGKTKVFFDRGLPLGHPLNQTGIDDIDIMYRFEDAPNSRIVESEQYRLMAGIKGGFGVYDWESAIGISGSTTHDTTRGSFSESGFRQFIGDYDRPGEFGSYRVDPNFFNKGYKIGQQNSAPIINALFPSFGSRGEMRQVFWDGKISGSITDLAAGPLAFATGFDIRQERLRITPSENLLLGDIIGYGISKADAGRTFGAWFGELSIPAAKGLEAQVAARVDKFPGFAAHLSPKLGVRFTPNNTWLLRSTLESGFRAPNLSESASSSKVSFNSVVDPKRCQQATALATDLLTQAAMLAPTDPTASALAARGRAAYASECQASIAYLVNNNPDLKPELSQIFTFGSVFEPIKGISASIDYWHIERRDQIGRKQADEIVNNEGNGSNSVNRGSLVNDRTFSAADIARYGVNSGALTSVVATFQNLSKTKTSGIDFNLRASLPWSGVGRVSIETNATRLLSYQEYKPALNGYGDELAGRYGYSRWISDITAGLDYGAFSHSIRLNYKSGYALQRDNDDSANYTPQACSARKWSEADCRVAHSIRYDYSLTYRGIKNLSLQLNLLNMFNHRPPTDYRGFEQKGIGIVPSDSADVQGRMLKVGLKYNFD